MDHTAEKRILNSLPRTPGVYIFKNAAGDVLYVGKANDLKSRVTQYFKPEADGRAQIPFMMKDAAALEHIVTDSEAEALLLENNLIKRFRPRYNIMLRDDKEYAFIQIDFTPQIPQICRTRKADVRNAKYYGPYSSGGKTRETMRIIRHVFSYCANSAVGDRPCFYYHLHRCPGVCIGLISIEEYKEQYIKRIESFLSGNISEVRRNLQDSMRAAAGEKEFEQAALLRDKIRSIEVIEERQNVVFAKPVNWDFISLFRTFEYAVVNVFSIRGGRLSDRNSFILEGAQDNPDAALISSFMRSYYLDAAADNAPSLEFAVSRLADTNPDLPKEIFAQEMPDDAEALRVALGGAVKISRPERGQNRILIQLGAKNAQEFYEQWSTAQASERSRTTVALDELAAVLSLPVAPQRIECFDISNIQGTNAVASMVVFEDAKPKKSEYRKFKMSISGEPDDFAMMREALTRRFKPQTDDLGQPAGTRWRHPDLLVIDGGKGQLGVAVDVLRGYGLDIPVIGLAKREEEIFRPGIEAPILLPKSNYALQLLQRLRDEAHRFGITFHRNLRSKEAHRSALDDVAGIGPVKKKALMKRFGSVAKIKAASLEDLAAMVGQKTAEELRKAL